MIKRFQATAEVLAVLKVMTFEDEGKLAKMPVVDRPTYVKLNKFLELCGGKWDRKAQGHVFVEDPRPNIEGLLETGSAKFDNEDFYRTGRTVAEKMINLMSEKLKQYPGIILEPQAGEGDLADVVVELTDRDMHVIEKNEKRREVLKEKGYKIVGEDFLEFNEPYKFIIMNPPFANHLDLKHVLHAYDILETGGVLVSVMLDGELWWSSKKQFADFRQLVGKFGLRYQLPEAAFEGMGAGTCIVMLLKV